MSKVSDVCYNEIKPDNLLIDYYLTKDQRGHLSQSPKGCRVLHKPTGIVVKCQQERSQLQNRENAMQILASKLLALRQAEHEKKLAELKGENFDINFGSQIRSYVLDDSRIKDLRTGVENSNTGAVLDGDLDKFIEASLKQGL